MSIHAFDPVEVKFLADLAQVKRDMEQMKQIVGHSAAEMERVFGMRVSGMGDALGRLSPMIAAAGFGAWIKSAIDAGDHMNDLRKTTSLTVEQLAGLKLAAQQSGSDLDGTAKAVTKLSVEIGKSPDKFRALGISARDPLQAFKQLADVLAGIDDPQLRAAVAAEALGKGWQSAAPLLAEGGKAIGEMIARGTELSRQTTAQAEASDEFNDRLAELKTAVSGSATAISGNLLPLLTALATDLRDVAQAAGETDIGFNPLTETLRATVIFAGNVAFVLRGIGTEIGGLSAQLAAFARGDIQGGLAIGKAMKEDAERARAAFDEWERKILNIGKAAPEAGKKIGEMAKTSEKAARAFLDVNKAAKDNDVHDMARAQALEYAKLWKEAEKYVAAMEDQEKAGHKLTEAEKLLAAAERQLPPELAAIVKALVARGQAIEDNLRIEAEMLEFSRERAKGAAAEYEDIAKQIEAKRRENEEIGLTVEQLQILIARRYEEQIAKKQAIIDDAQGNEARAAEVALIRKQIEALYDLKGVTLEGERRRAAADQAREIAQEYARGFEDIQSALTDAIFDGGEDGLKGVEDLIKRYTRAFAAQFVIRPIIQPIYAEAASMMGVDMRQAGGTWAQMGGGMGGLGGASNLFSLGSNAYSMFGGAAAYGPGSAYYSAATSGIGELFGLSEATTTFLELEGIEVATTALTEAGVALGTAMPYVAAAVAALALFGGDLFGGEEAEPVLGLGNLRRGDQPAWDAIADTGSRGNAQVSPFGTLVMMGQHLGGEGGDTEAIVSEYGEKFLKPIVVLDQALASMLAESEIASVADTLANWSSGEFAPSDEGITQMLTTRLDLITDAVGGWVNDLADTAAGSLETVYGQVTAILSLREQEGAQSIAEALLGEGGADVLRAGETAAGAFARLVTSLDAVNGVLADIDQSAYALTLSGGDAASELLALFGTIDQFRAATGAYYQEFFSEQERLANATGHLTDAFADLDIAMPGTHAGFRTLVEGLDLTTDSGRETFAALMGLAPAFDQITDAAEAAAAEAARAAEAAAAQRQSWQEKLDVLTGATTQRQIDWQHDLASTTDTTTQAIISQYYAQLGLADATQAATERADYIAQIVADQRDAALGNLSAAQDDLRRAYDAEYAAKQKIIDQFGDYLASLRDYRNQLLTGDLSPLDPMARTAEAERQYQDLKRRSALGDLEAIGRLQGGSQSYLQNMLAGFGRNSAEYAAAFYDVQDTLAATESLAERQIAIANDSLAELRSQTAGLLALNDSVLSMADAIANLRIAQQNVTALGGSGGGSPSGGVIANPSQSVAEQWFATYATSFSPSAETIGWWNDKIADTSAEEALAQFLNPTNPSAPRLSSMLSDPDYAAYVLGLPGHADGGIAQGLFSAGERGTEIMYSPSPVRVLSNNDSRAAVIDGGEVSALLKRAVELLAKVVDGQHADQSQRGAAATATIAELSDLSEKVDAQRRTLRTKAAA